jgi:class 3 adenylate cyclase
MELLNVIKTVYLKSGENVEVKVGVHTGKVISGVVGDTKP